MRFKVTFNLHVNLTKEIEAEDEYALLRALESDMDSEQVAELVKGSTVNDLCVEGEMIDKEDK